MHRVMRSGRLVLAAAAGIVVSFLLFAALTIVTPDENLQRERGEVAWQGFQFEKEEYRFTENSIAVVVNDDPVPLGLVVSPPGGANSTFQVPPNATVELELDTLGVYRLQAEDYKWGVTEIEVQSGNPFVRFYEGLF